MPDFKPMSEIINGALAELRQTTGRIGVVELNAICANQTPKDPEALARLRAEYPDIDGGVKRLRRYKHLKGRPEPELISLAVLFAVRPILYRAL